VTRAERAELIAALRRGDISPDRAADLLAPKKPGPKPQPDELRLAKARERIARVEAVAADQGSLAAAYRAIATADRKKPKSIERQHDADKTLVEEAWVDSVFNDFASEG
jgi:hypothetical protein